MCALRLVEPTAQLSAMQLIHELWYFSHLKFLEIILRNAILKWRKRDRSINRHTMMQYIKDWSGRKPSQHEV